jgi:hypothetical protein
VRIPLKAISDSGAKPITIPEGSRSSVGAKRRWHFDVAKIDRNRQVESCPEREQRFGLNRGLSQLPSQTGS